MSEGVPSLVPCGDAGFSKSQNFDKMFCVRLPIWDWQMIRSGNLRSFPTFFVNKKTQIVEFETLNLVVMPLHRMATFDLAVHHELFREVRVVGFAEERITTSPISRVYQGVADFITTEKKFFLCRPIKSGWGYF